MLRRHSTSIHNYAGLRTFQRGVDSHRWMSDRRPLANIGDRVFATAAPHIWNCLPASVKAAQSLMAFRHQLKVHLSSDNHFRN
jgi:hypothetical protein